jgi:hypothetical protein
MDVADLGKAVKYYFKNYTVRDGSWLRIYSLGLLQLVLDCADT